MKRFEKPRMIAPAIASVVALLMSCLVDVPTAWAAPVSVSPPGEFRQVSNGDWRACAISVAGQAGCWGDSDGPPALLAGKYREISVGGSNTCAIREDRSIDCWGYVCVSTRCWRLPQRAGGRRVGMRNPIEPQSGLPRR